MALNKSDPRSKKTRVAVVGHGNVGKGVEKAIESNRKEVGDMTLAGIITRRPNSVKEELERGWKKKEKTGLYVPEGTKVVSADNPEKWEKLEADVAILCGGSKTDLPVQGPVFASFFNSTVDSFDTHTHMPPYVDRKIYHSGYFKKMDNASRANGNLAVVSIGWDPGTFSLERTLGEAILIGDRAYGFYGLTEKGGLSQGHSDAIRQIRGVKDARQYTHAIPEAIERVRQGENPDFEPGDMHWRECKVVLENDIPEERTRVEMEIKSDPDYFAPYETTVEFVKKNELENEMPHDGLVIVVGETSPGNRAVIEYKNEWDSNPEATGRIMTAYARAAHRLYEEGETGRKRIVDIPISYVNHLSSQEITNNKI